MTSRRALAATARSSSPVLSTPDDRYIIVRDRLWRKANPSLSPDERARLTNGLMAARRAVAAAQRARDDTRLREARAAVNDAKTSLGERGPVWWTDGARDYTRFLVRNTPYAAWYAGLARCEVPSP
jgi:hypothetical protein